MQRFEWGGEELTSLLQHLVAAKGGPVLSDTQAQQLKKMCARMPVSSAAYQQLCLDPGQQGGAEATTYNLPDGQQIKVTTEGHQVRWCACLVMRSLSLFC